MKHFLVIFTVLCSLVFPALAEWDVPNFQQNDPEWTGDHLGDCPLSVTSFGAEGCGVTSTASLFAYYDLMIDGQSINPAILNQKLQQNNGYSMQYCGEWSDGECIKWYNCNCNILFSKAAELVNEANDVQFVGRFPALDNIDTYLLLGPVIARLENMGHFVVVTGKLGENLYSVMDPLYSWFHLDTVSFSGSDTLRVFRFPNEEPLLFLDVQKDYWAWEYIADMKGRGIMQGMNNMFYPDNQISRGEICTMIVRARNLQWNPSYSNPFVDLPSGHSHYQSVLICYHLGYVSGIGNHFYPDNHVLRRDAAKMICNGFEIPTYQITTRPWSDYMPEDDNFQYAYTLKMKGVLGGYLDGRFGPNNNLTRAEAAKIFSNALALE